MKRKISYLLITLGSLGILSILLINFCQKLSNNSIVNQIKKEGYDEKNYYVGYVELYSLKIPLVYGTTNKELNQNVVGIDNHSTTNHLILAGHAIETVFLSLYDIKLNDEIIIQFHESNQSYYVDYKKIVFDTDVSVYQNTGLTLITCIDKHRRLIVHAKTAN